jgi:hypothetical protein
MGKPTFGRIILSKEKHKVEQKPKNQETIPERVRELLIQIRCNAVATDNTLQHTLWPSSEIHHSIN